MNMTLSKRGDYVMRSAIALARSYESGAPRKIREVVEDTEMPRTFASQILADLVRAGLANSRAGRDGGYRLSRPPSEISVLEIVEAAEGSLRADRCALGEGPCRWESVCPLHETWTEATARLAQLLSETSLAEVAARDEAIEAGRYSVPPDSHRAHARAAELSDMVHIELPTAAVHDGLGSRRNWSAVLGAAVHDVGVLDTAGSGSPLVAECSIEPSPGENTTVGHMLAWRLFEPAGRSHFEGELHIEELDAERSELRVNGQWHQDLGNGDALETVTLEARAHRVLRSMLRRVAREIEEGAELRASPSRRRSSASR